MFTEIGTKLFETNVITEAYSAKANDKGSSLFYNTSARHEWHEFDTNDTISTQVKNFDFGNDASENIFSHPYISYMANKRLQGEE